MFAALSLVVLTQVAPVAAPDATQRIDYLVGGLETHLERAGRGASGLELSVPHGVGVTSARTELLVRVGWWQPPGGAEPGTLVVPLSLSWSVLASTPLVRPFVDWDVGGYLVHRERPIEVAGWSATVHWLWMWSSRLRVGTQIDLWRRLALRLGVEGAWRQRLALVGDRPAVPAPAWGLVAALVVSGGVPRIGLVDRFILGHGTKGDL